MCVTAVVERHGCWVAGCVRVWRRANPRPYPYQFVPDDLKDDKYWARRRKNNMAAKRSRDARRMKENQIAMRAGYLEKEVSSCDYTNSGRLYRNSGRPRNNFLQLFERQIKLEVIPSIL